MYGSIPKESGKGEPNIGMVVAKFTSKFRKLDRSAFVRDKKDDRYYRPEASYLYYSLRCHVGRVRRGAW